MLSGSFTRKEKSRKLVTQMMNSLIAKSEMGSLMASMYLLGNPDHYTSHKFIPFFWRNFINYILNPSNANVLGEEENKQNAEKVVITKNLKGKYVGYKAVLDYVHRPTVYNNLPLYTWIQTCEKCPIPKIKNFNKEMTNAISVEESENSEDELDLIISCNNDTPEPQLKISAIVNGHAEAKPESESEIENETDHESDELDVLSDITIDEDDEIEKTEVGALYTLPHIPQGVPKVLFSANSHQM